MNNDRSSKLVFSFDLNHLEFSYIRAGLKTVEGFVNPMNGKIDYRAICQGDFIIFTDLDNRERMASVVEMVTEYFSVREYLESEGLDNCLPWVMSLEQGIKIYEKTMPNLSERIKRAGIFGVKIKVTDKDVVQCANCNLFSQKRDLVIHLASRGSGSFGEPYQALCPKCDSMILSKRLA